MDPKQAGQIGGQRRAARLSRQERIESARAAAKARWAKLSSEQRSEVGRTRVMARWKRLENEKTPKHLPPVAPTVGEIGGNEPVARRFESDSVRELSAIARRASYLSRTYSRLPLEEEPERSQLLAEFHSAVAEFFELRTSLLDHKRKNIVAS